MNKERQMRLSMGEKHIEYRFFNVPEDLEWHITKMAHQILKGTILDAQAVAADVAIWKAVTAEVVDRVQFATILQRFEEEKRKHGL